ncbi:alpha-L-rhamnosidase [Promicromonospora umidemergens]|uniref:alpha-L-rhamnosidase n=1 Tax=Promicromonospora umidemergens TaxID=629679 RepID=A0ABP8XLV0_9MICO|nr:family 78 glycoside hydrolase catalytic domain [Promicromonospora umidemergens]MCP2285615.1 alpha-L-rhamnosidase [Promicromonospora umidemergens]
MTERSGRVGTVPGRLRVDARSTVRDDRFVVLATSPRPRLSWSLPLVRDGQAQTAFEAVVRDEPGTSVWTSGVVESADPWTRVSVDLAPHALGTFTVRCQDEAGAWSPWATPVPLETGPHTLADWGGASWVATPPPAVARRTFELARAPRRARLHLTAQGLMRASVNGTPVNASASDPSRTDAGLALFRTYEVTDLLVPGSNVLDLALARGEWARTGLDPRVLATLVVEHADGSRTFHGTGAGMLVGAGPVTIEEPFYLEAHEPDRALELGTASVSVLSPDRPSPGGPSTGGPGNDVAAPPRTVRPDPGPPLHVVETLVPAPVASADAEVRLFDVGVNVAGRSRLIIEDALPAGTVVQVVHGEHVGSDGRLDTTNLTMPFDHGRVRQAVRYTIGAPARGTGTGHTLEPWFSYHGFRYLEVTGLPAGTRMRVEVRTLHSDLRPTGDLTTDAPLVDALVARGRRTVLNNVHGIPEDCPTREQSGWTGDTASAAELQLAAFDMQAFFTKWLADLRTSQQPDGAIPAISPDVRAERVPADPVWGAALQRVLENHWLHYGDLDVVLETLPALRGWVDFQLSCAGADGTISLAPISYGHDWLALEQTPPELHHTAATLDALRVLATFEELTGAAEAAGLRRAQADALRQAARAAFVDPTPGPDGLSVGNGSQGSLAVAVESGWLTPAESAAAVARLEQDVRLRGDRVSSGFATTRTVVRALARHGRSQVLFDALHQPAEPGIGAMLDHGPGTFWECWWIDPENTGTGSLDHVGLGGPFAAWAWEFLAGVRPVAGGYARFVVEPCVVAGLTRLTLDTETVRGRIEVRLDRDGSRLDLALTVPVGAEALVRLPGSAEQVVGPGRHRFVADAPVPQPAVPHAEPDATTAPWAPLSTDVDGDPLLLQAAIADQRVEPAGSASAVAVLEHGLRCMPVPHAQLEGPVLRVSGGVTDGVVGEPAGPLARLRFPDPLDLTQARFVFAMFDLCSDPSARALRTELRLISADGETLVTNQRLWPAGWVRTTLAVAGWAGAGAVVAIEAGVRYVDGGTTAPSGPPAVFHLGQIGFSRARPTWP